MLFNELVGRKLAKEGNWPGVTVAKQVASCDSSLGALNIIDLPGIYSLRQYDAETALDAKVVYDYVAEQKPDLIINIVNADQLSRHLFLTTQLLELSVPMILVVNMVDVAKRHHKSWDTDLIGKRLGIPVIPMVATQGQGLKALKTAISQSLAQRLASRPYVTFNPRIQSAQNQLLPLITQQRSTVSAKTRALAYLAGDLIMSEQLFLDKKASDFWGDEWDWVQHEADIEVADARYTAIKDLLKGAGRFAEKILPGQTPRRRGLDRLCLHRFFGIPIFFGIIYLMFVFAINVGGAFQDFF